jgi:hypothetical protein
MLPRRLAWRCTLVVWRASVIGASRACRLSRRWGRLLRGRVPVSGQGEEKSARRRVMCLEKQEKSIGGRITGRQVVPWSRGAPIDRGSTGRRKCYRVRWDLWRWVREWRAGSALLVSARTGCTWGRWEEVCALSSPWSFSQGFRELRERLVAGSYGVKVG